MWLSLPLTRTLNLNLNLNLTRNFNRNRTLAEYLKPRSHPPNPKKPDCVGWGKQVITGRNH